MSRKTANLGLTLTGNGDQDTQQSFQSWRNIINGESAGSNMNIIDTAVGDLRTGVSGLRSRATNLENQVGDIEANVNTAIEEQRQAVSAKADNLYFDTETNLLYLVSDGEIIGDGVAVAAGGGGGGGGTGPTSAYTITLQNMMASRAITATKGSTIQLIFSYTSIDGEGNDDGAGVGKVTVGGRAKLTFNATQGINTLDITQAVDEGVNNLRLQVENSEGAVRTISYTVTIVTLGLTTTNSLISGYTTEATFYYTVTGTGDKTVHFLLDGAQIGTEVVSTSGRSRSYVIPQQQHGMHILEVYASTVVNGVTATSDTIRLCMYWANPASSVPIIASPFNETTIPAGDNIVIPYVVYNPDSEIATVTLNVFSDSGALFSSTTLTRDRSEDTWVVSNYPTGNISLSITCGSTTKTFRLTVTGSEFPISVVEDGLVLEFSAVGRSNNEQEPATWSYGENIVATFSGFGFSGADGWITTPENTQVLRFLPGDRMVIPFKPFANDFRGTGYTIEIDLATRDVRDYETIVASCLNNGTGFVVASQSAQLSSEQSSVSMLFKEDSRIRVAFVVEQAALNRMIYIYINGIMCGAVQYPQNDNFAQRVAQNITIGADSCGLDLYSIRCYTKGLNRNEQLDNYICDRATRADRQAAYDENDILDGSEAVVYTKLPNTLPYMIISCAELPQFKGDKKPGCEVEFVDPTDTPDHVRSFIASGVEADVQGTSSAAYPVKNFKLKLKSGIEVDGEHEDGCVINDGNLPVSVLCLKADYASCEGANNVELVQLYEEVCREQGYLTPPQRDDERVRQGIAGRPIVLFWHNTTNDETTFVGKMNMNYDKDARNGFGFNDNYPNAECWEYRNNTSNVCLFKDDDLSAGNWEAHLEAREPDGYTDTTALSRVYRFVVAHNRDTVSTAAAKAEMLADFKAHFDEYFVRNNMLFYYLFTETFLMIDSRAKNMFLTTYDGTHWLPLPYDFDTALGIGC